MKRIEFEDALVVEPAKVSILDEMPVGSVIDYEGDEVPTGWEAAGSDDYSTEETFTGKYWIDDKKIYRKVVDLGEMPNVGQKNVAHNISNLGDVIYLGGYYTNGTNTFMLPSVRGNPEYIQHYQTGIWINNTNVVVEDAADRSEYNGYAIIEYTKTTD